MPGSATMDPNVLVDDLAESLIDDLRTDLHTEFGVRAYRVFTVLRTYESGYIDGELYTETETEITPQPLVKSFVETLGHQLEECGIDEAGIIKLEEVSLTYTLAELDGGDLVDGQEWLIRLREAHGQGQPDRDFVLDGPPYPDRIKTMGWQLKLRIAS